MGVRWSALLIATLVCGCGANPAVVAKGPIANPVIIQSVIPYLDDEVGNADLRSSCDWNRKLPGHVVEEADGRVVINEAAFDAPGGRKLSLTVVNMHVVGGKGFTGPKWAGLRGKLTEDGKLIGSFENSRATIAGSFGACATVQDLGEELAEDVSIWLLHPAIDTEVKD